ncbi:MAG: sulfite exporter TauE/SafE family protein [Pirellulales bacterium]|nr:sulfite exporter TauE/SafE family protein [Pirellulales bacterium]
MMKLLIASVVIFLIALLGTMAGRGGGNFYVPALVATGQPMHQAATTGQLILLLTASAGMLVFQKHGLVDWKLAMVIDPPTDVMAFVGGSLAHIVPEVLLKFVLAGLLVIAGFLMLMKAKERPIPRNKRFGFWYRCFDNHEYVVNLWLAIPIAAATGLAAGAVGISGGSFKVPLMVLLCGVPMRIAVATSSAMVAVTALMGFIGHTISGDFYPSQAVPLACVAMVGGLIGAKLAVKAKPHHLKQLFAWTTFAAAVFMIINAGLSK